MKILKQFMSNPDLKKLYIINQHCTYKTVEWDGCGNCPGTLRNYPDLWKVCGLRRVTSRSMPKCALPCDWYFPREFWGLKVEFSDEELKDAVQWFREILIKGGAELEALRYYIHLERQAEDENTKAVSKEDSLDFLYKIEWDERGNPIPELRRQN